MMTDIPEIKQIIPVYFTYDRNFVVAANVAIYSLLENADKRYRYELYVVHNTLKRRDMSSLIKIVSEFSNADVHFITMPETETYWKSLSTKSHFSKEIFYKLTAADLFPNYDRILFSDTDVIFKNDISKAYFMFKDDDFYFAGPKDPFDMCSLIPRYSENFTESEISTIQENEISAGFMLINLKQLRKDDMTKNLVRYYKDNVWRFILPEQDCIALTCKGHIRNLPNEYVICNSWYLEKEIPDEIKDSLESPIQLHFPGPNKPWNSTKVNKREEWMFYCKRSNQRTKMILSQPLYIIQRIRRYSIKRFFKKCFLHSISLLSTKSCGRLL